MNATAAGMREGARVHLLEQIRRKALCLTLAVEPAEKRRLWDELVVLLGDYHRLYG